MCKLLKLSEANLQVWRHLFCDDFHLLHYEEKFFLQWPVCFYAVVVECGTIRRSGNIYWLQMNCFVIYLESFLMRKQNLLMTVYVLA